MLEREGHEINTAQATYLLSLSEIRRYIPGSVLSFISRINYFKTKNIESKTIAKLIFYESITFLVSSIITSIPALFYLNSIGAFNKYGVSNFNYALILTLLFCILVAIYFANKTKINNLINRISTFKLPLLLIAVAWIFFGVSNYLIASSFYLLDPKHIIGLSSFFILSWLVGYLVVIAPLGLGVREAAIVYGLSFTIPAGIAAAISILVRIGMVIAEIIFLALSYGYYKLVKKSINISYYTLSLWGAIFSYVIYFSYVSTEKHLNFFTGRFDLGNMDQTVWNTLNGNIFLLSNPDSTETISRLAFHADFILILIAPFYLLWDDPRTLLIIQSFVLGMGAYFVYRISLHALKSNPLSLVFALSYLLNPFLQKQNLFDFHAITLATTFFLGAFYYSFIKNYKLTILFLLLAAITKENAVLTSGLFCIYLWIKTNDRRWLFGTLAGIVVFYLLISNFIPGARGGEHFAVEYFGDLGSTPGEIIKNTILNPINTFNHLFTGDNMKYLYRLFLPVGFLSILSPFILLFVAPDFAINLLSSNSNFRSLTFHYAATLIPFVYVSSIYGSKLLLSFKLKYVNKKSLMCYVAIFSLLATYFYGTLPGSKNPTLEIYTRYLPERREIKNFLNSVPQDLSVSATNNLGAHLSHRKDIYTIPMGLKEADVVVFLLNDSFAQPSLGDQIEMSRMLRYDSNYIEVYRVGNFSAFAKREKAGFINK